MIRYEFDGQRYAWTSAAAKNLRRSVRMEAHHA